MTYLVKTKQNDHSIQFVHYSDHQFIMDPDVGKAQLQLNRFQFSNYLLQCLLTLRDYIEISNIIHLDSPGNKVMYCENNEYEILSLYEAQEVRAWREFDRTVYVTLKGQKFLLVLGGWLKSNIVTVHILYNAQGCQTGKGQLRDR